MLRLRYSSEPQIIECGCDEAGRGCIAGPVAAAAVILPPDYHNELINDSKQLSRRLREQLRKEIERDAVAYAVVMVSEQEIDETNILAASLAGMRLVCGTPTFLHFHGVDYAQRMEDARQMFEQPAQSLDLYEK